MGLAGIGVLAATVAGVVELDRRNDAGIRGEYHEVERKLTHSVEGSVRTPTCALNRTIWRSYLSEHDVMGKRLDESSVENLFRGCE